MDISRFAEILNRAELRERELLGELETRRACGESRLGELELRIEEIRITARMAQEWEADGRHLALAAALDHIVALCGEPR